MAKAKENDYERVYFSLLSRFEKGIKKLTDEEAGRLLKAIYGFELDEQEPDFDEETETLLAYLWYDIHEWLENNKKYYRKKCEMASLAGKLSAEKRKQAKASKQEESATVVNGRQRSSTNINKNKNPNKNKNKNPNEKETEKEKVSDENRISAKAVSLIKAGNHKMSLALLRLAKDIVRDNPEYDDADLLDVLNDLSSDEETMKRYQRDEGTLTL
jgi:hypothetical protein